MKFGSKLKFISLLFIIPVASNASFSNNSSRSADRNSLEYRSMARNRKPLNTRGIWMHYHSGSSYGTSQIIGNTVLENQAINRFQNWKVGRVYNGLRELPVDERKKVAKWNYKLKKAGISSQILLGEPHHIFPGANCRDSLLQKIHQRLINFHQGVSSLGGPLPYSLASSSRFDGLHLDIEPQAFKASYYGTSAPPACAPTPEYWNTTTSRANLFSHLHDTLVAVRNYLNTHGHSNFPIYIDLPRWIDTSASLNWSDTPDFASGIAWLASIAQNVDGITFMTYERDNAADIRQDVLDERMLLLNSINFRVSVNAKERLPWLPLITTWLNSSDLWSVVEDLESGTGLYKYPVDIHNYRYMASPWILTEGPYFPSPL